MGWLLDDHNQDVDAGWSQDGGTNCGHNLCSKVPWPKSTACSTSISLLPHIWCLGTTLAGTISQHPFSFHHLMC